MGGGGGGRPTMARAGGRDPEQLADALAAAEQASSSGSRPRIRQVKVLALDYGRARTGVAVSDPTGTLARPLAIVERVTSDAGLARLTG